MPVPAISFVCAIFDFGIGMDMVGDIKKNCGKNKSEYSVEIVWPEILINQECMKNAIA